MYGFIYSKGIINFGVPSSGDPPAGAVVAFIYGDGTRESGLAYGTATAYPHEFKAAGTYTVTANVSNSISYAILTLDVTVVVPVANLRMLVVPPHAPIGQPVTVGVYMDKGNDVTLYWNCDYTIGDTSYDVIKKRTGT